MSRRLSADIIKFLKANPKYKSWDGLPEEFLSKSARLPAEAVIEVAIDVWKEDEHRFLWAAGTLLRRHPAALSRLRWRALEEMGNRMDSWGAVDAFAFLAGPAWRAGRISDARVRRWARLRR